MTTMAKVDRIDSGLLDGILKAGQWSETAEDNAHDEHVSEAFVSKVVLDYKANPASQDALVGLGLLTLMMSVAEWGIAWQMHNPPGDTDDRSWHGPESIRQGKHLMSYALGGIGLPHLDVTDAVAFFNQLITHVPDAENSLKQIGALSSDFVFDNIRSNGGTCEADPKKSVLMTDIDGTPFEHDYAVWGGMPYCGRRTKYDPDSWQVLRHWSRLALRRRDMQEWVILFWLNHYWVPAFNKVMGHPRGTIKETFVIARIWNSGSGKASAAFSAAGNEADPAKRIEAEYRWYEEHTDQGRARVPILRRQGIVYDLFSR